MNLRRASDESVQSQVLSTGSTANGDTGKDSHELHRRQFTKKSVDTVESLQQNPKSQTDYKSESSVRVSAKLREPKKHQMVKSSPNLSDGINTNPMRKFPFNNEVKISPEDDMSTNPDHLTNSLSFHSHGHLNSKRTPFNRDLGKDESLCKTPSELKRSISKPNLASTPDSMVKGSENIFRQSNISCNSEPTSENLVTNNSKEIMKENNLVEQNQSMKDETSLNKYQDATSDSPAYAGSYDTAPPKNTFTGSTVESGVASSVRKAPGVIESFESALHPENEEVLKPIDGGWGWVVAASCFVICVSITAYYTLYYHDIT